MNDNDFDFTKVESPARTDALERLRRAEQAGGNHRKAIDEKIDFPLCNTREKKADALLRAKKTMYKAYNNFAKKYCARILSPRNKEEMFHKVEDYIISLHEYHKLCSNGDIDMKIAVNILRDDCPLCWRMIDQALKNVDEYKKMDTLEYVRENHPYMFDEKGKLLPVDTSPLTALVIKCYGLQKYSGR